MTTDLAIPSAGTEREAADIVDDVTPTAAVIAETVGRVHTMAASAASGKPRDAAEIQALSDAMVRLLIGTPLHSDG